MHQRIRNRYHELLAMGAGAPPVDYTSSYRLPPLLLKNLHRAENKYRMKLGRMIETASKGNRINPLLTHAVVNIESGYKPQARSRVGAVGLMQLMPQTAETFGVKEITSPQDNIQGGLKFLIWLDKRFKEVIEDPDERLKFVLASYNVGPGHVEDAMRLAEKNNKNPHKWDDNVDYYLLNKSKPSFYNDPVVKYGYCRGEEPFHYVNDILERYTHYKNVIDDQ
jgi:membrane-bound lytic murein transglycosylase MltF